MCLVFFNVSCGLDVLSAVLEDPVTELETNPNEESSFDSRNFKFQIKTINASNDLGYGYVYYKIYNRISTRTSEVNRIVDLANDANKKTTSASTMRDTYSYKELKLYGTDGKIVPLKFENDSQIIDIRLTSYSNIAEYSAYVKVNGTSIGIPLRSNDGTFNFAVAKADTVPQKGDDDTKNFADPTGSNYYVALFYVFMMYDDTYTPIYSPVHYLGTVMIDSSSDLN